MLFSELMHIKLQLLWKLTNVIMSLTTFAFNQGTAYIGFIAKRVEE
jgi:hypothetical protein